MQTDESATGTKVCEIESDDDSHEMETEQAMPLDENIVRSVVDVQFESIINDPLRAI
ncbi:hypothetical protein DPMN_058460 [Dreissena polymorpha]|uniref:Uncharacterized protein n=1 Tax=Dreissena polymorpha TaxID=45954 RepID=A0A9D4C1T2_DREPO|nr:hypothetical protein DPMN_058460 [Dreissena polymorpha]